MYRKPYRPLPEGKRRQFVHSPFTIEHEGNTRVSCSKDGRITITQGDDKEYDEVEIPASLVFTIANMINNTKKVHIVDKTPREG